MGDTLAGKKNPWGNQSTFIIFASGEACGHNVKTQRPTFCATSEALKVALSALRVPACPDKSTDSYVTLPPYPPTAAEIPSTSTAAAAAFSASMMHVAVASGSSSIILCVPRSTICRGRGLG